MTQISRIPGLHVDLKRKPDGGYEIAGQHLGKDGEYEYWLNIAPDDVLAFAVALGANAAGIGQAWQAQVQEIAVEGESTWLKRNGIPYRSFTWS
jgi:hypothetical protein